MGRSKTTANWTPTHDQPWSHFIRWLRPDKPAASKEVRPYVGGTLQHGRRTIRTVEQRYFLTLDADYADVFFPADAGLLLEDTPYLLHTTWRHLQGEYGYRYRLIIPLSRGVEPNEYKELAWAVMNRLDGKRFDVTTAQAERFMWGPSTQDEATYYWTSANPRAPYLPVDEWLDGQHGPSDAPAAHGQPNPPPATPATSDGPLTATDEDKERAVEILLQACDQVEHVHEREEFAGRNEAVFHWMPLLFRFCDAGALDEDTVKDALWSSAQRVPADEPYGRTEFKASVKSARQYADETGPELPQTTPTKMAQADFEDVDLDVDIWSKTRQLQHIKQVSDYMGRNPYALIAIVLARVLVEAPAGTCLPGAEDGCLGDRAAINLGVALVGSSGQGKSSMIQLGKKVLGRSQIDNDPSTGQGLIQKYLRWDDVLNENVLDDEPRHIFTLDEIDKLGQLGKDTGSTLLSEMRTMLTGGSTGTTNATKERQRSLYEGTYNFQLILGVQPKRAGVLLEGSDAGMPQRFIWVPVTDPKNAMHPDDRPPWPGALDWDDAFFMPLKILDPVVRYPDWLLKELKEHDYKVSQEGTDGGEMSRFGHHNLLRLKVAAGVAFLHESTVIEDLHVEIADTILRASRHEQLKCEKAVADAAYDKKKAARRSDERVTEEIAEEKLAKLVKRARKLLIEANGEWVTWHNLRPTVLRDRDEYGEPVWEAIAEMEDVECKKVEHGERVRRTARIVNDTP